MVPKLANKSEMILYNKTVHVQHVKFSARVGSSFRGIRPEWVSERIWKTLRLFKRHFEDVRHLIGSIRYGCGCRYNFMKRLHGNGVLLPKIRSSKQ
ncbi:hypothetical protein OSTOST_15404 [Ostertagia ostertagi]